MPLEKIHPFAAGVAAYVCGHSGATPELPPLEELL
jgi:sugar/nucleoside kinase (ribokinase family)